MKYCCKYSNHYVSQSGGGGIPVFYGRKSQSGHGLGQIFSSLGRVALPFFKTAASYLGRKAVDTGKQILGDVIGGRNFKESLTERLKDTGRSVLSDVSERLQRGSGRRRKRKSASRVTSKKKKSPKKNIKKRKTEKTILD